MQPYSFIRAKTPDGSVLINLANVTAIVVDDDGSFAVKRRVTVHFQGTPPMNFDEEYGDKLLATLGALDERGRGAEATRVAGDYGAGELP
jgi:hypothetical protein